MYQPPSEFRDTTTSRGSRRSYDIGLLTSDTTPQHTIAVITKEGALATVTVTPPGRLLVFGDIHGDLSAFEAGLSLRKHDDVVIFLGDYADRGPNGVEVIEAVDELLVSEPDRVVALFGNHEDYTEAGEPKFVPCDLVTEAEAKRESWPSFFVRFQRFVKKLQIAALIPGSLLCVHGGVFKGITPRRLEKPDVDAVAELIWSDPGEGNGTRPSRRGVGHVFGGDISDKVCSDLGVRTICRSHEPRKAVGGPFVEHAGRIVTTSSTSMYGGDPYLIAVSPGDIVDGSTLAEASIPLR